ncbi:DNA methyltransferase [Actinoplanes sp. CA-030573]|uniref:DNA methyltransferase n=1 Tax=Actinoplanes sp. CA-030573 TaxID=3239898 RepID=UPI003D91883F
MLAAADTTAATTPHSRGIPSESMSGICITRGLAAQRHGRFVSGSSGHPDRMAPDIAAALIRRYTAPGDLVFDPLAGTGTTLVEAIHADRNAAGIEYEPGWTALARANLALASRSGAPGHARIVCGDATRLPRGLPAGVRGQVRLLLTSPPSRRTMPGHDPTAGGLQFTGRNPPPAGHPNRGRLPLIDGLAAVMAGSLPLLTPDGIVVITARSRDAEQQLDMPGTIIRAGLTAGLTLINWYRTCDGRVPRRHPQTHSSDYRRAAGCRPSTAAPQRTIRDHIAVFIRTTLPPAGTT